MRNDGQWGELTSENERIIDSAEFRGIHRAAIAAAAGRAGPVSAGDPVGHSAGPAPARAARSPVTRTRRWCLRPR